MTKIWANKIDNRYDVYVETYPDNTYKGQLKIELKGEVIFEKEVDISYGAGFGPDAGDVDYWSLTCFEFIDARNEASLKTPSVIRFNSIKSFDHVYSEMKSHFEIKGKPLPKVTVIGTPKIHGANRAIVFTGKDCENHWLQTRDTIIIPGDKAMDGYGFGTFIEKTPGVLEYLRDIAKNIKKHAKDKSAPVQIYGEWAGPNIAGKVANAVEHLTNYTFFIFNARSSWDNETRDYITLTLEHARGKSIQGILFVNDISRKELELDLNNPEPTIELINKLTMEEEECSILVRKAYIHPPEGCCVGEGLVWSIRMTPELRDMGYQSIFFKTKGSKHKKGKRTMMANVDAEYFNNVDTFVTAALDGRLDQGLEVLKARGLEINRSNFTLYVKWIIADIEREEAMNMDKSGIKMDDVTRLVGQKANKHFLEYIKKNGETVKPSNPTYKDNW